MLLLFLYICLLADLIHKKSSSILTHGYIYFIEYAILSYDKTIYDTVSDIQLNRSKANIVQCEKHHNMSGRSPYFRRSGTLGGAHENPTALCTDELDTAHIRYTIYCHDTHNARPD